MSEHNYSNSSNGSLNDSHHQSEIDLSVIFVETEISETMPKLNVDFALRLIPDFNGDRKDFHKFVSCCDVANSDLSQAADSQLLVNIIKSKLSGSAYNVVKHKTFTTWDELKAALQEQFLETRSIAQLQSELIKTKQNQGESVRSFANRVEQLLNDLNDACIATEGREAATTINNLNSKTAFKTFVEGLNYSLKLIIKASRFTKLSDAIEAAVEEERNLFENSYQNKTFNKNKNKTFKKCNFCKRNGHLENECFIKNRPCSSQRLPTFPKRELKSEVHVTNIVCAYCKKQGHHIKDCFKKKRADEFKNNLNQNARNPVNFNSQNQGNSQAPVASSGSAIPVNQL